MRSISHTRHRVWFLIGQGQIACWRLQLSIMHIASQKNYKLVI
jgi:hypothetical protein